MKISKWITGALCSAALLLCTAVPVLAEPDGDPRYNGVDISRWQGSSIDFGQVKDAGVDVVYMRAGGSSDFTDPDFERNYAGAKDAGLKVGFYFYTDPATTEEAEAQAAFFASLVEDKDPDCRLAMEFVNDGLNKETVNELALVFLRKTEELTGHEAVVYCNASTARTVYSGDITVEFPLWVAEYGVEEAPEDLNWDSWVGWQYTNTGSVPGIDGAVDRDHFTAGIFLEEPAPTTAAPTSAPTTTSPTAPPTGQTGVNANWALLLIPCCLPVLAFGLGKAHKA